MSPRPRRSPKARTGILHSTIDRRSGEKQWRRARRDRGYRDLHQFRLGPEFCIETGFNSRYHPLKPISGVLRIWRSG
jgi:hypothetical protein